MSDVTRKLAGIMLDSVEENFEKEGRPKKWTPLSDSTIKKREKKGFFPRKILQREGLRAGSISP